MRITRFRVILAAVASVVGSLALAAVSVQHEPDFYRRGSVPAGPRRMEQSNEFFVRDFVPFIATFDSGRGDWSFTFTQEQLNSFFEEDFIRFGDADYFRKLGITSPRIEFSDNQIRIGFRYGTGAWSTILSYDLKIWLAKNEVNVMAVEIQRRRAGALPIPTQQVFHEMKEIARRHNLDVEWYRHNGNPVAIIKFQSDRMRPSAQLQDIQVRNGEVRLQGRSFDPVQSNFDEQPKKAESTNP